MLDQFLAALNSCESSVIKGTIYLSIVFVIFTLAERIFGIVRQKKPLQSTLLDLAYAYISLLYPPFLNFIISAVFGFMYLHFAGPQHQNISPVRFACEYLAVLFVRDCLIYARHRIFHTRPVWAFHSVHHSSEEVNWLSAVRFHPAENMIESAAEIILFILAGAWGVDAAVLSVVALTIGFYNLFIHSNLPWTFGPLRYVIVSPVFHRWHHSDTPEARDKNFAAIFSCIDLLFGTFYMPKGLVPETTGLSPEEKPAYPKTLIGQLLHPFRNSR